MTHPIKATTTAERSNVAPLTTRGQRWLTAGLAATAMMLTLIGLSGVGDAPDPHASTDQIADWFMVRRTDVLLAAPFGYLGALTVVVLAAVLAGAHRRAAPTASARVVIAGGVITSAYLFSAHLGWTANAYLIADSSPQAAKAVFVMTITSVPVFALGVMLMAGAAAVHAPPTVGRRSWRVASAVVAAISSLGMVAIADRGFLSPDVQQQTIANALLAWLLVTTIAAVLPARAHPSGSTSRTDEVCQRHRSEALPAPAGSGLSEVSSWWV